MVFSLVITVLGLGTACALLYYCAMFALPMFIGLSVTFWALNAGAGVGGVFVGFGAGVLVFVLGQLVFSRSRSPVVRWAIALLFALPASVAGYSFVLQLAELGVPSIVWRHAMAVIGAALIGFAALTKLGRPSNEIASGVKSSQRYCCDDKACLISGSERTMHNDRVVLRQ